MTFAATLNIPVAPSLRRVRKEEVVRPAFDRPDPYTALMTCWADYMRTDDRNLSTQGMRLVSDAQADRDVHEEQHLADLRIGEAVNAMVDSLTVQQRWAIYRSQRISTVWRFQNANYETVLLEARDELEQKLKKNVATRLYFA
jgi:hypothetical protein